MIIYKSPAEIDKMRRSGKILAATIERVLAKVRVGDTTAELDEIADSSIRSQGATPSFLGYGHPPFPASICASINEEIVHGIPSPDRSVKDGDLLKLDFGAIWEGFHSDSAVTVIVGDARSADAEKLVRVTEDALEAGISQVKAGGRLSDIGAAVQQVAEGAGFSVVREYVGHGIGRSMHEDPQIPNFGEPGRGPLLEEGMVLAVEPMVTAGRHQIRMGDDNWAIYSQDGSLAAHFEFTIAVTADGPRVLTPWHEAV
jgi:methionyl aminopeptidase